MTPALDHTRRLLDTPPTPPIPGQLDLTSNEPRETLMPATDSDDHIEHQWILTHPDSDHDDIYIDLWTDGYTVRVEGGDGDDGDRGQRDVDELIAKYTAAGYQRARDYAVNDPEPSDAPEVEAAEPADRPDECPECGSAIEYQAEHAAHGRSGPAWLCLGCRWGEWINP
ncbi:hypothetical protein ACFWXI_14600 [[Kitasatospora] papulosa]|uniref:hypothetical protein n=1 Tax=[Kitasatospora] papulosa TaxID=1464011 RepID=UPI0036CD2E0F